MDMGVGLLKFRVPLLCFDAGEGKRMDAKLDAASVLSEPMLLLLSAGEHTEEAISLPFEIEFLFLLGEEDADTVRDLGE